MAIPPGRDAMVKVIGVLRERRTRVDPNVALDLPASSIAAGFLGPLGQGRWGKMTIHVPQNDVLHSYTAWIDREWLQDAGSKTGVTVEVTLEKHEVPTRAREWICTEYQILG